MERAMLGELFTTWWDAMQVGLVFALLGGGVFAGLHTLRDRITPEATWMAFLIALVIGGSQAFLQRSLVDHGFIHFRIARNVLAGEGPVFNPGEVTEVSSALGWTLLLALGGLTGLEIPTVSVLLTGLCYVGLGATTLWIGQGLWERDPELVYLPFAAMLILVQGTITPFATTGMETAAVALATLGAAAALVDGRDGLAGGLATLGAILRPDHLVFWVAGLVVTGLGGSARALRFGLSGLGLGAFFIAKFVYYGSLMPTGFDALGASAWPVSLGLERLTALVVGEHLWLVAALFAGWWLASPPPRESDLRRFATLGVILHVLLVTALGATQTYGQVYVTDIVLLLLGAEALTHHRTPVPSLLAAALLGATVAGLPLIAPQTHAFRMADTHTFFPLERLEPVRIRHHLQRLGTPFQRLEPDTRPALATCCGVGVLGYFSEARVVHTGGLTDGALAAQPLDIDALRADEVDFLRQAWAIPAYRHLTAVQFLGQENLAGVWHLLRYDRQRLEPLQRSGKAVSFTDMEAHLDRYIQSLSTRQHAAVARDLDFFDRFYFDHNDDPDRRTPIADKAAPTR
jgi:hypothetical protein